MHTKVKNLCYIALFAALIAVCTWITVPGAVPFTMQTFAVFCALLLLGGRDGTIAVGLYPARLRGASRVFRVSGRRWTHPRTDRRVYRRVHTHGALLLRV